MYNTNVCRYVLHLYNICIQIHAIGRQLLITVHNELLANSPHRCWPLYSILSVELDNIAVSETASPYSDQVMEKSLWCNRK